MTKGTHKEYGPCKLEPFKLGHFRHLRKSTVNQTIDKVNQLVMCLFKQKLKLEEATIINLLKHFNVPVPKGHGMQLDWPELKKPDFLFTVNLRLMQKLNKVLNEGNKNVKPEQGSNYFKFYVGWGNNHTIIRQVIKRRSWWHR